MEMDDGGSGCGGMGGVVSCGGGGEGSWVSKAETVWLERGGGVDEYEGIGGGGLWMGVEGKDSFFYILRLYLRHSTHLAFSPPPSNSPSHPPECSSGVIVHQLLTTCRYVGLAMQRAEDLNE